MLPEIFRLLWWTLIHRPKKKAAAKKTAARKTAKKKTARRTAHKKTPAPRTAKPAQRGKVAAPRPHTVAA